MPGMRIAETVTNNYMATVVNNGTILDTHIIEKLKNMNYQKIRVYIGTDQEIEDNPYEAVRREYGQNVDNMKDVLHNLTVGKALDISTIDEISSSMFRRREDVVGILSCLNQVRDADEYTYSHCLNVAFICLLIAKWLNYSETSYNEVLEAGLLHDVGKCRVPAEILNKPARLTPAEFAEMKKHPVYGYQMLEGVADVRATSALAALEHHEKTDGTGYPFGLHGKKIHPFGKICAVADIYDAMTSNRVYHKKESPFEVFRILEDLAFGSLDPTIVVSFLQNLAGYYIGDRALLSNGQEGLVVFINPRSISRPVIQTSDGLVNLDDSENHSLIVSQLL
jgi:putative nucleotidyltransferase with HDIG domain